MRGRLEKNNRKSFLSRICLHDSEEGPGKNEMYKIIKRAAEVESGIQMREERFGH